MSRKKGAHFGRRQRLKLRGWKVDRRERAWTLWICNLWLCKYVRCRTHFHWRYSFLLAQIHSRENHKRFKFKFKVMSSRRLIQLHTWIVALNHRASSPKKLHNTRRDVCETGVRTTAAGTNGGRSLSTSLRFFISPPAARRLLGFLPIQLHWIGGRTIRRLRQIQGTLHIPHFLSTSLSGGDGITMALWRGRVWWEFRHPDITWPLPVERWIRLFKVEIYYYKRNDYFVVKHYGRLLVLITIQTYNPVVQVNNNKCIDKIL